MNQFPTLFSPITIGKRVIKNRIVSSAHGEGFAHGGLMNEQLLRYYERKAEGGTGLIMAFGSGNVYEKATHPKYVSLWNPKNESLFRELSDRIHAHGSLLMAQGTHKGRRLNSKVTGHPIQAPSAIAEKISREIPAALRTDQIKEIVQAFADSAARLERCGFDGMEITSYGGHLIEQFWSPAVNQRTDQYGGDLTGRMRFSMEVLEAIAEAVSDEFIITFRMTGDPLAEETLGLNQVDMLEIALKLDSLKRINVFHISGSSGDTATLTAAMVPPDPFPRGLYNHLSQRMKEYLSVPVLVAGRILDPNQAEMALAEGDCDLVAMTRAIIADPDMPRKAMAGEVLQIRPCIGTNQGCIGRTYDGLPMGCAVNPAISDDRLYDFKSTTEFRKVAVIGGGPAGMEAARVAAERGHKVVLFERSHRLGGQILFGAMQPDRDHYGLHIDWVGHELQRLGVDIRLGIEARLEDILALNPDSVVLATGSKTIIPREAEGLAVPCITDVDLLSGKEKMEPGARIFIYDAGGSRGTYAAIFAVQSGAGRVELATPLQTVCEDLDSTTKPTMLRSLAQSRVVLTPNQNVIGQREGVLTLRDIWSNTERAVDDADLIVFAGYRVSLNHLEGMLREQQPDIDVYTIGDSLAPRSMSDAVAEGVRVGNKI